MKVVLLSIMTTVTAILLTALIGVLAYWQFYPYKVFTFNEPTHTVKDVYQRGETLTWAVDLYSHTEGVKVDLTRELKDGVIINYPEQSYVTKKGLMKFTNASLRIPTYIDPGIYVLEITNVVHINPIRNIVIVVTTPPFEIK